MKKAYTRWHLFFTTIRLTLGDDRRASVTLAFPRRRRVSDDWIGKLTFGDLLHYLAQYAPGDVQALRIIAEARLREAVKGQGLAPIQQMPT